MVSIDIYSYELWMVSRVTLQPPSNSMTPAAERAQQSAALSMAKSQCGLRIRGILCGAMEMVILSWQFVIFLMKKWWLVTLSCEMVGDFIMENCDFIMDKLWFDHEKCWFDYKRWAIKPSRTVIWTFKKMEFINEKLMRYWTVNPKNHMGQSYRKGGLKKKTCFTRKKWGFNQP